MKTSSLPHQDLDAVQIIASNLSLSKFHTRQCRSSLINQSRRIPKTSEARLQASLSDNVGNISASSGQSKPETYLYLGYGSNLSAEAFLVKRGIKPLSQLNVVVPDISLTFDLAGMPYTEPCFGNCRFRRDDEKLELDFKDNDYHKNRWRKGLVGVVYEVTADDYAHIIATEGGSSGYQDVLVDCYPLSDDPREEVPQRPDSSPCRAHTLFAHLQWGRPDPAYAQPSARYMKLITDGAEEHALPYEYRAFLDNIRTYRITTRKQQMGQKLFLILWGPIIGFIFTGGAKSLLGPDGKYPEWFKKLLAGIFMGIWISYDRLFKPAFGDGERTVGEGDDSIFQNERYADLEKAPLLGNGKTQIVGAYGEKM